MRISILGNAGGGKSTLARRLAREHALPYVEVDGFLWTADWQIVPEAEYDARHREVLDRDAWILDGMGLPASLEARFARSTSLILVDLPLWQHYWLAADRQAAWAAGTAEAPPGGRGDRPDTRRLFEFMWMIDRDLMPGIRAQIGSAETAGTTVYRIRDVEELNGFRL